MSADAEHAVLQDDVPNQQLLLEPSRLSDVSSASLRTPGIRCIGAILQSGMRPSRAKSNNCPTLQADSDPKYLCEPGARFQFIIQSVSLELEVGTIPVWSLFTVTTNYRSNSENKLALRAARREMDSSAGSCWGIPRGGTANDLSLAYGSMTLTVTLCQQVPTIWKKFNVNTRVIWPGKTILCAISER